MVRLNEGGSGRRVCWRDNSLSQSRSIAGWKEAASDLSLEIAKKCSLLVLLKPDRILLVFNLL